MPWLKIFLQACDLNNLDFDGIYCRISPALLVTELKHSQVRVDPNDTPSPLLGDREENKYLNPQSFGKEACPRPSWRIVFLARTQRFYTLLHTACPAPEKNLRSGCNRAQLNRPENFWSKITSQAFSRKKYNSLRFSISAILFHPSSKPLFVTVDRAIFWITFWTKICVFCGRVFQRLEPCFYLRSKPSKPPGQFSFIFSKRDLEKAWRSKVWYSIRKSAHLVGLVWVRLSPPFANGMKTRHSWE